MGGDVVVQQGAAEGWNLHAAAKTGGQVQAHILTPKLARLQDFSELYSPKALQPWEPSSPILNDPDLCHNAIPRRSHSAEPDRELWSGAPVALNPKP